MSSPADGIPLQDLLQNLDWVRGVARAVAGEAEADDLAQETWLRTAESPPQRIETVRAWLRRVLRNAHFEQRRTDARRREREAFATAGVEMAALEAPDEVVARAEAQRRMVDALFQLDPASRQLLILRYFQQWTPAQIAASLGEPAGTVRARLSRALARLRARLAKDEGRTQANLLIAGAAGLAKPASSKLIILAAAAGVCVLAFTAGLLLNSEQPVHEAMGDAESELAAALPAASLAASIISSEEPVPGPTFERVPAIAAHRAAFTVSGRCVASPTGGPLEGVRLSVHLDNSCWPHRPDVCAQHVQIETHSGSDGRFSFSFDPPAAEFRIEWAAAGWVTRHAYWREMPATPVEDFGTVVMDPGLPVTGRVEDEAGQPVAGVFVGVGDMPLPLTPNHVFSDAIGARSAADGAFTLPVLIPAGVWPMSVSGRGSVLLSPTQFELSGAGQTAPLVVRIRQMPSVQGVCVDEQGAPIAGVNVRGKLSTDRFPSVNGASSSDGSFALFARQERDLASTLTLEATAQGRLILKDPVERAWGDRAITLVLKRAPELSIEVVEAGSGQPVPDYTLFVQLLAEPGGLTFSPEKISGPHSSGRASGVLQIGSSAVRVAPDSELWAVPPMQVLQSDGVAAQSLRVELVPTAKLRIQLLAGGAPVPGALVECFLPGTQPPTIGGRAVLLRSEYANANPGFPIRESYKECEKSSDSSGLVELPTQPEAGARWLRLTGPFEHFVKEVAFDPAAVEPIQIELPAGCRFRGNLRSRWTQWPDTVLILVAEGARPGHGYADRESHYYTLELAEDGSFDLAGIRPGRYDLLLDYDSRAPFPGEIGFRFSPNPIGAPLGTFVLQPGLDQPWTLEYPDREPGAVSLTVTLDGAVPAGCALTLWRQDEWSGSSVGDLLLTADGSITTDWITPGPTRVGLKRIEAGSGRVLRSWTSAEELLVRSGQTLTQSVAFVDRAIRVRLLDRDGVTPLPGLDILAEGRVTDYGLRSDANGWYEFDWVPQSPLQVSVAGAGSDNWTAELSWSPEELDVVRTLIRP